MSGFQNIYLVFFFSRLLNQRTGSGVSRQTRSQKPCWHTESSAGESRFLWQPDPTRPNENKMTDKMITEVASFQPTEFNLN